jgi:predicted dithiol-disulfide oxidoreductase (DUF899 family)
VNLPQVVSQEEWQQARDALLAKEKAHTRAMDALNAERRRLPMVKIDKEYVFEGPDGKATLLDLFDGNQQLIVYHFMMHAGDPHRCPGCSMMADNFPHPSHLGARSVRLVVVAPATLAEITEYWNRMGWTTPFYSSHGNGLTEDLELGKGFGISVFLRDGDDVYRTYFTTGRGADQLNGTMPWLDLTPFGRQESWEEPAGRGSDPAGSWWRLHDEY